MNIIDSQDGKLITLSKAFDERAKILYAFYFVSFFCGGTIFLWVSLDVIPSLGIKFLLLIFMVACYISAYRFLNKALMTEKIFFNNKELKIIKTGFINSSSSSFEISQISNFRHLDKPEVSDHPLAGQTFDYLGFQTEQKVINEMHGDNRLGFEYYGKTILFGQNIYSWQFEELKLLFDIALND